MGGMDKMEGREASVENSLSSFGFSFHNNSLLINVAGNLDIFDALIST